jgi:glycosyltransferase involved in cell wall biosynthesis
MLRLALALRERGHEVELGCPEAPEPRRSLSTEARAAGLPPQLELSRGRGARWLRDRADAQRLQSHLRARDIEIVHCWHTRDHVLAWRAAGARRRSGPTALVRSYRRAEAIRRVPWNRWLFGAATDGLLCVSPCTAERNARLRSGRPIEGLFGAVDLERFRPGAPDPHTRVALGLPPSGPVVGIVARAQHRRRFELLLAAAARFFQGMPQARLLVVGRGTHRRQLAERPAARLGIGDRVVFAGYREADYGEVLRTIDLFTFLVPGSDGTCRAVLEAAACGIPAVTTRRGALPEIVSDGETGVLVDEDPEALAEAWQALLVTPQRRRSMGEAARRRAECLFAPERLADQVASFYEQVRKAR